MAPAACSAPDVPIRGASNAAGPWMLHSGGRRFLLLDPPRTIQSGASGFSGAAWPRLPFGVAPRPWLCGSGARCPGSRHLAAVVAWHLSPCRGCGRRRASLACLVAPRGAPRLVRSGRSRCSGRISRRRGALPHPGGFRPRIYWAAARGTRRPAENRAHCACRWPPLRQGSWARSASDPFGAPRWGCPWRVPPASVLGCVRCAGWRVWSRSLMRPVSRTVRLSTGDSAGAPGLFRVDADTSPCELEDATPGSRACVRVLVRAGRVGRAGLPGAFWCASPFPQAALLFCSAPSGLGLPLLRFFGSLPPPPPPRLFFSCCSALRAPLVSFFLWFPAPSALGLGALFLFPPPLPACVFFSSCAPVVSGFLLFPAPAALGLGALCCLFCWPPAPRLFVRSRLCCVSRLAVGCSLRWLLPPPPPPPLLCLAVFRAADLCSVFFSRCASPLSLAFACFRPWVLWALALCAFCFVGLPLLGSS